MKIEITLGSRKQNSTILIDGKEITRGILDFSISMEDSIPTVTLKVWPETLKVNLPDAHVAHRNTLFAAVDPARNNREELTFRSNPDPGKATGGSAS